MQISKANSRACFVGRYTVPENISFSRAFHYPCDSQDATKAKAAFCSFEKHESKSSDVLLRALFIS
jgi:hypothetical protein